MDKTAGKTELAIWLAAFIDADGMITIHKQPHNGNGQLVPRIVISTTCEKTKLFLGDALAALEVGVYVTQRRAQKSGWKDVWMIQIVGMKRCKKALDLLLPYFVTKEEEAKELLRFINERLEFPMRRGYTAHQLGVIDRLKAFKRCRQSFIPNLPTNVKLISESSETLCPAPVSG